MEDNNLLQTNTFEGGMNSDVSDMFIKNNEYRYAENIRIVTNTDSNTGEARLIEGYTEIKLYFTDGQLFDTNENEVFAFTKCDNYNIIFVKFLESDIYKWSIYRVDLNDIEGQKNCRYIHKIFGPCPEPMWDDNGNYNLSFEVFVDSRKKLYFADGHHLLMSIDIMKENGLTINNIQQYTYTNLITQPEVELNYSNGNLKSGIVQYCYQLYNRHENLSNVSPLSLPQEIFDSSTKISVGEGELKTDCYITEGSSQDTNTNASVNLKIKINDTKYKNIIIYRIHYIINGQPPLVDVVYDENINVDENNIMSYTDVGNSITSYNVEYLQSKVANFSLIPKLICSKNNYLFAANVKVSLDSLFEDWDAKDHVKISITTRTDGVGEYNNQIIIEDFNSNNILTHREDLYKYKSLKDGETYRYGIVLYSKDGLVSSAKWIGDITPNRSNYSDIFQIYNSSITSIPIGVRITIDELPKNCIGYEIVRCTRTLDNTRCITQGVLSNTLVTNSNYNKLTEARISQSPYITLSHDRYGSLKFAKDENLKLIDTYYIFSYASQLLMQFISPEISFFGDQLIDIIKKNNCSIRLKNTYCPFMARSLNMCPSGYIGYVNPTIVNPYYGARAYSYEQNGYYPYLWISFASGDTQYGDSAGFGPAYIGLGEKESVDSVVGIQGNNLSDFFTAITSEEYEKSKNTYKSTLRLSMTHIGIPNMLPETEEKHSHFYSCFVPKYLYAENPHNKTIKINSAENVIPYDMRELFKDDTDAAQDKLHDITVGDYKYSPLILGGMDKVDSTLDNRRPIDVIKEKGGEAYKYSSWIHTLGLGCKSLILNLDKTDDNFKNYIEHKYKNAFDPTTDAGITLLCNIEKTINEPYGGVSTRNTSLYMSTGNFFTADEKDVKVFDGDTYLQIYEHVNCHKFYDLVRTDTRKINECCVYYHIPVESSINLALSHGEQLTIDRNNNKYKWDFIQLKPNEFSDGVGNFVQTEPMYKYNTAYNQELNAILYSGLNEITTDSNLYKNRIYYSEYKVTNDTEDQWNNFKSANFLDVDNKYGEITKLYNFNNGLYFWQENGFGILSVNEKQLLTNSNGTNLLLGTGDVLQRYDYLSYVYGIKKDTNAITNSQFRLYWYDHDRKTMIAFDGSSIHNLNEEKNLTNCVNNQNNRTNYSSCFYDNKYKEIVFDIFENKKSVVYNELIDKFTSVYDLYFKFANNINGKIFIINNEDKLCEWNEMNNNPYTHISLQPTIQYIINKLPQYVKVYDNILFDGDFDYINYNTQQSYSYTSLMFTFHTTMLHASCGAQDITRRELNYKMPIPRNRNNSDYGNRIRGKNMLCEIKYLNNNPKFELKYILTKYRISWN